MAGDNDERRRYERVPGRGLHGELRREDRAPLAVVMRDVSRSGVALTGVDAVLAPGTEVTLAFSGDNASIPGASIPGRVARNIPDGVAIAFRQNPETLAAADRLMELVSQRAA